MKRTFKGLLAAAGLAFFGLGSLLTTQSANAALVTCSVIQPGSAFTWPLGTNAQKCGTVDAAKATSIYNALNSIGATYPNALTQMNALLVPVFFFKNKQDFDDSFNTEIGTPLNVGYPNPGPSAQTASLTGKNTAGVPKFTVVFQEITFNAAQVNVSDLGNKAVHEVGHSLDYAYSAVAGIGSTTAMASDGIGFTDHYDFDYLALNELPPCGANSLFGGRKDGNGVFFCGVNGTGPVLTAPYAGKLNKQVIQLAFPQTLNTAPPWKEYFSEVFAIQAGFPDSGLDGLSIYLTKTQNPSRFACISKVVDKLAKTGQYPSPAELEAATPVPCYTKPFIPVAPVVLPSGISCGAANLYDQGALFTYPTHLRQSQYVYCGATPANYKDQARQVLANMTGDVFNQKTYMKNWFLTNNVSLYVFKDASDAIAYFGAGVLPASITNNEVYGYTLEAPVGNARTKFVLVFERAKNASGVMVDLSGTIFSGSAHHYTGRMINAIRGRLAKNANYIAAFNQDKTAYNAKATCTVLPTACSGGVVLAQYQGMTNLNILLAMHPKYVDRKYFALDANNEYGSLFAEQYAVFRFNSGENIDGIDSFLNVNTQFGKCTQALVNSFYTNGVFTRADATCPVIQ